MLGKLKCKSVANAHQLVRLVPKTRRAAKQVNNVLREDRKPNCRRFIRCVFILPASLPARWMEECVCVSRVPVRNDLNVRARTRTLAHHPLAHARELINFLRHIIVNGSVFAG